MSITDRLRQSYASTSHETANRIEQIEQIEAVNSDLLAALKAVEWHQHAEFAFCYLCDGERFAGHEPDCIVGLAIAKAKGCGT